MENKKGEVGYLAKSSSKSEFSIGNSEFNTYRNNMTVHFPSRGIAEKWRAKYTEPERIKIIEVTVVDWDPKPDRHGSVWILINKENGYFFNGYISPQLIVNETENITNAKMYKNKDDANHTVKLLENDASYEVKLLNLKAT